jgi:hypothetical protein
LPEIQKATPQTVKVYGVAFFCADYFFLSFFRRWLLKRKKKVTKKKENSALQAARSL